MAEYVNLQMNMMTEANDQLLVTLNILLLKTDFVNNLIKNHKDVDGFNQLFGDLPAKWSTAVKKLYDMPQ